MKHKIVIVSLMLLLAFSITVSAQSDGLLIWMTGGEEGAQALQNAAAIWTETSGVPVTVEAVGWGDAYARYLTAVNSGTGADMFIGGMSWGISLGNVGGLIDLSAQFGEDVQALLDNNNPAFVDSIIGLDGAVYGIPYNQDVHLLYYLTENLAQVGFEAAPTTWEEFTDAISALQDAGLGGAGMGWGNASWLGFQTYLAQAGGTWYADDCSAPTIDSEAGFAALEYFTSLYEDFGFPAETVDPAASFSTGEISMAISGEWHAPGIDTAYPELEGKWAVAPMPAGPVNNAAFIGGSMIGLFSYSSNADAAWDFMQWLQTPEAAEAITANNFINSAILLPVQPANYEFIKGGDMVREAISAQLENTSGPANCPGWEESNADINLVLQSVLFEGMDFEDALAEMNDILAAALEEYGG